MKELLIKYEKSLIRLHKIKEMYKTHFQLSETEKDEIKNKSKIECVNSKIFLVKLFIKDLKSLQDND
jgi:transcriptional regulatory protein LevR